MSAVELLLNLQLRGLGLEVRDGGKLAVTPSRELSDDDRAGIRRHLPELVALLTPPRPFRLTQAQADACHSPCWDDAEIETFTKRVALFIRRGVDATNADDLAERLVLRDREVDDRRLCLECRTYRALRCGNHRAAGLTTADIAPDLAALLQRCPGFSTGPAN